MWRQPRATAVIPVEALGRHEHGNMAAANRNGQTCLMFLMFAAFLGEPYWLDCYRYWKARQL